MQASKWIEGEIPEPMLVMVLLLVVGDGPVHLMRCEGSGIIESLKKPKTTRGRFHLRRPFLSSEATTLGAYRTNMMSESKLSKLWNSIANEEVR